MKRGIGLILFWASSLLWLVALSLPWLLNMDAASMAGMIAALLVISEISFAMSLFLLGRPFYQTIKIRCISLWRKISGNSTQSSSD